MARGSPESPTIHGQNCLENRYPFPWGKELYWIRIKCQSEIFVELAFPKNLIYWALKWHFHCAWLLSANRLDSCAENLWTAKGLLGIRRALIPHFILFLSLRSHLRARRAESWRLLTSSSLPGKWQLISLFAESGIEEHVAGSSRASLHFDSPREKYIFPNFLFAHRKLQFCEKGIFSLKILLLENSPTSSFPGTYSHINWK